MDEQDIKDFIKAGEIAGKARDYGAELIKEGEKVVDILDKVENKIKELGGGIAFPAQISINQIAAHYCSEEDDQTTIKPSDVVKLDVGAHINGFIGDTAKTVNLDGKYKTLLDASENALNNALKKVKSCIKTGEIGKVIQETITETGFSPVKNLSGHGLAKFQVHTKPNIPNVTLEESPTLIEGMTVAIEPFATNGAGSIQEGGIPTIFSHVDNKPVRSPITREVFKRIKSYNNLPFTTRWLSREFGLGKTKLALRDLQKIGNIHPYPPLTEVGKGMVSQFEHSMLILKDEVIITTKLK